MNQHGDRIGFSFLRWVVGGVVGGVVGDWVCRVLPAFEWDWGGGEI